MFGLSSIRAINNAFAAKQKAKEEEAHDKKARSQRVKASLNRAASAGR